jgi:hypothetical protein
MEVVEARTQEELNNIDEKFPAQIRIYGDDNTWLHIPCKNYVYPPDIMSGCVVVNGKSDANARGNSIVIAAGRSFVQAFDNSIVGTQWSGTVQLYDNAVYDQDKIYELCKTS